MTGPGEQSQIVLWAVNVTMALTVLGLVFSFVRLIRGPSLPDRVVSVDLITVLAVAIAGLLAITHTEPDFLDIAVALALVAFLATVAFAWYAERINELRKREREELRKREREELRKREREELRKREREAARRVDETDDG